MCRSTGTMSLPHVFKKMVRVQSARIQCTLCACSVFSALFGMFMTSVGVCLVLNYNIVEVDTSGLPPQLHNEEGKKVVGIILICVGVGALVFSGLVSALYFTACFSRTQDHQQPQHQRLQQADGAAASSNDQSSERGGRAKGRRAHPGAVGPSGRRGNTSGGAGAAWSRPSTSSSGGEATPRGAGPLPVNMTPRGKRSGLIPEPFGLGPTRAHTPPSMRAKSRHKPARLGPPRYQQRLAPHPEEEHSLHDATSRASSAAMLKGAATAGGHVNHAADIDDDENDEGSRKAAGGSVTSESSGTVRIVVDKTQLCETADDTGFSEGLSSAAQVSVVTDGADPELRMVSEYLEVDRGHEIMTPVCVQIENSGENDDRLSGLDSRSSFSADSDRGSTWETANTSIS